MTLFRIAPSILAADIAKLGEEVSTVVAAGADFIHIDVMDNHYVPNLTFGPLLCQALRDYGITAPLDVHLMIKPVDRIIPEFAKAGATYISFHPEASEHIHRTIQIIHDYGCKAGLAFNPATPLNHLDHIINELDLILIMSVNPGFGGQKFLPEMLPKIKSAHEKINSSHKEILLEVDGGINLETMSLAAQAGADTFVAGTAIFKTSDYKSTITQMRNQLKSSFG